MATAKMSATLDEGLLEEVRVKVGPRRVSAFVNSAVQEKLQRLRVLELLDALDAKHGAPSAKERAAAEAALRRIFRAT
jgi:hypothetical protein